MTQLLESATTKPAAPRKRTAGLVGSPLVLVGVVLYLAEFVGIIATGVHSMPDLPGASPADLMKTYSGQASAVGFMVGWIALCASGRLFIVVAMRGVLARSGYRSTLTDLAVPVMAATVALEPIGYALCSGAVAAAGRDDVNAVVELNTVAHSVEVGAFVPYGLAFLLIAWGMWRSGVFPRVLTMLLGLVGVVDAVSGALFSAPSGAHLQDDLSTVNLLLFVLLLWLGILVFLKRPRAAVAHAGLPSEA